MDEAKEKVLSFQDFSDFVAETTAAQVMRQLPYIYKAYMIGCGVQHQEMVLKVRVRVDFRDKK